MSSLRTILPRCALALQSLCALASCDPYASWPDPQATFPYVYTEEEGLPDYAHVRVETETWVPIEDLEETLLYAMKSVEHRPGAPIEALLHFGEMRPTMPPLVEGDTILSFVGDVMRFDGGWATFADPVRDRLPGVRIGNLETPVSDLHPTDRGDLARDYGVYAFNSPAELVDALPLDIVQLNNNHSLDVGDLGLVRTWKAVYGTGRAPIGADDNRVDLRIDGLNVSILSYTWGLNVRAPSAYDLHVIPFGHLDEPVDLEPIERQIEEARDDGATHVVLLVHWGYEYEYYPDPHFMQLGRQLVALGADVVAGSGPHCVQPAEICDVNRPLSVPDVGRCSVRSADGRPRTAAVLYSLGDFGTDFTSIPLATGIIASVSLRASVGVTGLRYDPVSTVAAEGSGIEIVPLDALTGAPEHQEESDRLDVLLGSAWRYRP